MKLLEGITIEKLKGMDQNELEQLAKEIRVFLIENVTRTGGHLASNLGTVELTLALHYVFSSPHDKIVWDVGHQAYVHKILTDRMDQFSTLRQYGGLAGFPRREESEHDIYSMGHSSDSISVGIGLARARDFLQEKHQVISVIGDGALTGGMALEALNDAGASQSKLIVVFNDNEMSISRNVGSIAGFLGKVRTIKSYSRFKRNLSNVLDHIPGIGKPIKRFLKRTKASIKYFFLPNQLFEEMGFTYVGLLDGHDMPSMIGALNDAEKSEKSVLIHVRTIKGCGCPEAEDKPELYHGVAADFYEPKDQAPGMSNGELFAEKLIAMAKEDERIVGVTAAMPHGTGLIQFAKAFPERMIDVGIAEQHAAAMCGGLAAGGMRPYFAVYSTFLQRAYDQIFHDICLQELPVVLMVDRAGLVGQDGETHHGVFDLSYLRDMPNLTVMAPSTAKELVEMMDISKELQLPSAIRYSKSNFGYTNEIKTEYGKWKELKPIAPVTIVAVGNMVERALYVARKLEEQGTRIGVINACFIKPMDDEMIQRLLACEHIITIEDNSVEGGFGSGLTERMAEKEQRPVVHIMGIPDRFITHGDLDSLFREIGLDEVSIFHKLVEVCA